MTDELTTNEIVLLCDIGERQQLQVDDDKRGDLQRLLAHGYVEPKDGRAGSTFQLTIKALEFLGQRGVGLNEA